MHRLPLRELIYSRSLLLYINRQRSGDNVPTGGVLALHCWRVVLHSLPRRNLFRRRGCDGLYGLPCRLLFAAWLGPVRELLAGHLLLGGRLGLLAVLQQ